MRALSSSCKKHRDIYIYMKNAFLRTVIIIIIIVVVVVVVVVVVIKGIQDSFGFWIPSTVFRSLSVDFNR